jgi:gamma-glutamylcyclotransferase (GGCT)/AIG2-like uncharacterized protein YtfP
LQSEEHCTKVSSWASTDPDLSVIQSPDDHERVFVYGSLKRGERNARHMGRSTLVGLARTRAEFTLVELDGYPGLVAGGQAHVEGEVYLVPVDHLPRLDRFEGHPSLYERTRIELSDGTSAFAYLLSPSHARGRPALQGPSWTGRSRGRT